MRGEDEEMDSAAKEYIDDFLINYREEIMDGDAAGFQAVEKKINNDLLFKNLKDFIDNLLEPYYKSASLRAFYVRNPDDCLDLVEEMFGKTILRFHADILEEYTKYGFDNMPAFGEFLNVFDSLCTYAVKKNLYRDAIEDVLYSQMRLQRPLCRKITDLIDVNFREMKLNYIIERLEELGED